MILAHTNGTSKQHQETFRPGAMLAVLSWLAHLIIVATQSTFLGAGEILLEHLMAMSMSFQYPLFGGFASTTIAAFVLDISALY